MSGSASPIFVPHSPTSRDRLDATLLAMATRGGVALYPLENPVEIQPRDREAILLHPTGNERHLVYLGGKPSMNPLDVVRRFDFDWAVSLFEVWSDAAWDVPALHGPTRQQFVEKLETILKPGQVRNRPLGWVLIGRGGSGKTHLLSRFRYESKLRKAAFVLVNMTDVRDFWETVLQGYIDSLQQKYDGDLFQHQCLVRNLIQRDGPTKPVAETLSNLSRRKTVEPGWGHEQGARRPLQSQSRVREQISGRRPCPHLPQLGGFLDLEPRHDLAPRPGDRRHGRTDSVSLPHVRSRSRSLRHFPGS